MEKNKACRILVESTEGKRTLRRSRRRWGDNNGMDIKQNGAIRIGLIWLRMWISGGSCENGNEPLHSVE
jgi:hypothetical protein